MDVYVLTLIFDIKKRKKNIKLDVINVRFPSIIIFVSTVVQFVTSVNNYLKRNDMLNNYYKEKKARNRFAR